MEDNLGVIYQAQQIVGLNGAFVSYCYRSMAIFFVLEDASVILVPEVDYLEGDQMIFGFSVNFIHSTNTELLKNYLIRKLTHLQYKAAAWEWQNIYVGEAMPVRVDFSPALGEVVPDFPTVRSRSGLLELVGMP